MGWATQDPRVSNQLVSLTSRDIAAIDMGIDNLMVSNQLVSLTSRDQALAIFKEQAPKLFPIN